ncbi:winged-helix domain-containing protein [Variovorax boronicumulans]|uniref:winged helix-turn-helix transcriptional regulator n=1 Tax=Variovorax boronicumulans TaxID=436515 RepID=UPI0036F31D47
MNLPNFLSGDLSEHANELRVALIPEDVEDGAVLRVCIEYILGCQVVLFSSPQELESTLTNGAEFDLLIIFWQSTSEKQFSQMLAIGELAKASMLFLARTNDLQKLQGISAISPRTGSTDFLLAPFELGELRLRLSLMATRIFVVRGDQDLILKDYHFRVKSRTVSYQGKFLHLRPQEFRLALEFFRNAGRVLTREWLMQTMWQENPAPRTLDVHISNLRRKLKLYPKNSFSLRSVYGHGYQLIEGETT